MSRFLLENALTFLRHVQRVFGAKLIRFCLWKVFLFCVVFKTVVLDGVAFFASRNTSTFRIVLEEAVGQSSLSRNTSTFRVVLEEAVFLGAVERFHLLELLIWELSRTLVLGEVERFFRQLNKWSTFCVIQQHTSKDFSVLHAPFPEYLLLYSTIFGLQEV